MISSTEKSTRKRVCEPRHGGGAAPETRRENRRAVDVMAADRSVTFDADADVVEGDRPPERAPCDVGARTGGPDMKCR